MSQGLGRRAARPDEAEALLVNPLPAASRDVAHEQAVMV